MTTLGTRLGRVLHYLLLFLLAILAIGALAGLVGLGVALFAPDIWPTSMAATSRGAAVPLTTPGDRAVATALLIAACALAAAVLLPLAGLTRSAANGAPFAPANVTRLRIMAGAFALSAIGTILVGALPFSDATRAAFRLDEASVDVGRLLMALVLLVLAEVFREGVRLREDAEGTI